MTAKNILDNPVLAINGGKAVRTKPFTASCFSCGDEEKVLIDCLRSNQWSSFKGATEGWKIKDVGFMSSQDAAGYGAEDIRFLGGRYVRQLEELFAARFGLKYAVSANSGTSALIMALGALNLGPGDEVIVPCMSFNATATAVLFFNSVPVFAEVKTDTFCLDPIDFETRITDKTRAVIVVHLGGNSADMDAIMDIACRHRLKVIEDCAQAIGVTYKDRSVGTFGDAGVFSLTETKNITCGEGGVLITNEPQTAFKARLIRNHGEGVSDLFWTDEELVNVIGMNFRLTEIQSAIAVCQLQGLDQRNSIRKENSFYLIERLKQYKQLVPPAIEKGTNYICFMLKWKFHPDKGMPDRDSVIRALQAEGIPVSSGYGRLMHENPLFARKIAYGQKGCPYTCASYGKSVNYGRGSCPRSEQVNKEFIWFKFINAPNTIEDMEDVARAFDKVLSNGNKT